jgi:hypothetical protein
MSLGEGLVCDLSPDGRWVMTITGDPPEVVLLPTGVGRLKKVSTGAVRPWGGGGFAGTDRICFDGRGSDGKLRVYVTPIAGGETKLVTEDLITHRSAVSPDGRFVALTRSDSQIMQYPLDGGDPSPVKGVDPGEVPIQWSEEGKSLYLRRRGELPMRVHRLDTLTGKRELWKTFLPADPTGVVGIPRLVLTRDGRFYAYTCRRIVSSELFIADGLY